MSEDQDGMGAQDSREALLRRGREAFLRSLWSEAYEAFTEAGAQGALGPDDLDALGQAAYCTSRLEDSIRSHEAAFAGYIERGDRRSAAMVAMWWLSVEYWDKGIASVAKGWDRRAARLLEDEPACIEQGWIAYGLGDTERALEFARRFGDRSLEARCLHDRGRELVERGELDEGMGLIDEVCTSIAAGDVRPFQASALYCLTTSVCVGIADYRRAREWSDVSRRYADEFGPNLFTSICRVHRAEIMNVQGLWDEAEREVLTAIGELRGVDRFILGLAFREVGEIRLKRGDLAGAEEAFRQAHDEGIEPQPGLALLRLAQGRPEAALSLINRALEEQQQEKRIQRTRLLRALVTIALEAGDQESAGSAATALDTIASEYGTAAMRGAQADARGALQLAGGNYTKRFTPSGELIGYGSKPTHRTMPHARSSASDGPTAHSERRNQRSWSSTPPGRSLNDSVPCWTRSKPQISCSGLTVHPFREAHFEPSCSPTSWDRPN